jgi:DinB family protein
MFAPFFSATADHLSRRQPPAIVAMLSGDATRLEDAFAGVPDAILSRRPADGEWCMKEIAGHMLDIADVACRRLTTVLDPAADVAPDRDMPPWELLDGQGHESIDASELTRRFAARVADAHELMASLDDAGWRRRTEWVVGRISAVDLGSWLANHNMAHQQQVDALLETAP